MKNNFEHRTLVLSLLSLVFHWAFATRRAFRYIFARSLAKDAAPIPNATGYEQ